MVHEEGRSPRTGVAFGAGIKGLRADVLELWRALVGAFCHQSRLVALVALMNAIESLNKICGIAFAILLACFLGYRVYERRNDLPKKLDRRIQQRLKQMSEDPRYQLPISEMKFPEVKFNLETMQGFNPGTFQAR
jgi:hypothetical protein